MTTIDQHAANELELYLENDEPLYRDMQACYANLLRKQKRGTYDSTRAIAALCYVADAAAKKYTKEYSSRGPHGAYGSFDKATRTAVAVSLRDSFEAQERNGELAHLKEKL